MRLMRFAERESSSAQADIILAEILFDIFQDHCVDVIFRLARAVGDLYENLVDIAHKYRVHLVQCHARVKTMPCGTFYGDGQSLQPQGDVFLHHGQIR